MGRVLLTTVLLQACGHTATPAPASTPRDQAGPKATSAQATGDSPADPPNHGTVIGTREGSNFVVHIAGEFAQVDIDAITAAVRRVCAQPVLSIVRRPEGVEVMTGVVCGDLCGSGDTFLLRKVDGTWTIVKHGLWVS